MLQVRHLLELLGAVWVLLGTWNNPLSVLLFVEGCAGIWGPLLPSSESSSAGSSCAPQLPLGQQEICMEFNIKVNN